MSKEWVEDGLAFTELIAQPYTNCIFSAGAVDGHPVDTLYLKLEREGVVSTFLLLRPDEVTALLWCLSGVLWASQVERIP